MSSSSVNRLSGTLLAVLLCTPAMTPPLAAQAKATNSTPDSARHFRITAKGVLETSAVVLLSASLDLPVRHLAQSSRSSTSDGIAQIGNAFGNPLYVAPPLVAAFLFGHLTHRPRLASAVFHAGESALIATTATWIIKVGVGRSRPYQQAGMADFHPFHALDGAFPSGHATLAFSLATALSQETGPRWLNAVWYGAAATTVFARINDDEHWLSDVVAGAAIGHFTAQWVASKHHGVAISAGPGTVRIRVAF